MIRLFPYQSDAADAVRACLRAGKRRVIIWLATGAGKTVIASYIVASALAKGTRSLFCAARRELIRQAFAKLLRSGLPYDQIGIVMAGTPARAACLFGDTPEAVIARMEAAGASDKQIDAELWGLFAGRRPQAPVQVASRDTLRNKEIGEFDLIIIDECHGSYSEGYLGILQRHSNAAVIGLTATPYRGDDKNLWDKPAGWSGPLFEEIVQGPTPAELRDMGKLVPVEMFRPPVLVDLSKIGVDKKGEYIPEQVDEAIDKPKIYGDVVRHWLERAGRGCRTVLFASSIKTSKEAARRFAEAGVRVEHVDGGTDIPIRDAAQLRLDRGETEIVCNCDVWTEGWDLPSVECIILLCPTKSLVKYVQKVGRGLRPSPSTGKKRLLILDHAGLIAEHRGGPYAERPLDWGGEVRRRRNTSDEPIGIKTCPAPCCAILPSGTRVCPQCGHVFGSSDEREGPEEEDGDLVEHQDTPLTARRAIWDRLCGERGQRSPGWVHVEYLREVGVKPPKAWKVPLRAEERDENIPEVLEYWRRCYREAVADHRSEGSAKYRFKERWLRWPSKPLLDEQRAYIASLPTLEEQLAKSVAVPVEISRAASLAAAVEALASTPPVPERDPKPENIPGRNRPPVPPRLRPPPSATPLEPWSI